MSVETKTTTRRIVTVDARVIAEFPDVQRWQWGRQRTVEEFRKALQQAVTDFEEFIRDHRSQDIVNLSVELIEEEQCTACGKEWDPMYLNESDFDGETAQEAEEAWEAAKGKAHCGWCGAREEKGEADDK